jgi:hypothetical protein
MDIDVGSFLASMVISSVGFVLFVYGKKMRKLAQMLAGITLLIFPYFVPGVLAMTGIAVGVLGLMWAAIVRYDI